MRSSPCWCLLSSIVSIASLISRGRLQDYTDTGDQRNRSKSHGVSRCASIFIYLTFKSVGSPNQWRNMDPRKATLVRGNVNDGAWLVCVSIATCARVPRVHARDSIWWIA